MRTHSRSARITVALTEDELAATRYVARVRDVDEGPLLRSLAMPKVLAEYRRLKAIEREERGK